MQDYKPTNPLAAFPLPLSMVGYSKAGKLQLELLELPLYQVTSRHLPNFRVDLVNFLRSTENPANLCNLRLIHLLANKHQGPFCKGGNKDKNFGIPALHLLMTEVYSFLPHWQHAKQPPRDGLPAANLFEHAASARCAELLPHLLTAAPVLLLS